MEGKHGSRNTCSQVQKEAFTMHKKAGANYLLVVTLPLLGSKLYQRGNGGSWLSVPAVSGLGGQSHFLLQVALTVGAQDTGSPVLMNWLPAGYTQAETKSSPSFAFPGRNSMLGTCWRKVDSQLAWTKFRGHSCRWANAPGKVFNGMSHAGHLREGQTTPRALPGLQPSHKTGSLCRCCISPPCPRCPP